MSTSEFLSMIHGYRSILWFIVFLMVLAFLMFGLWFFADHADKKENPDLQIIDDFPKDHWGD